MGKTIAEPKLHFGERILQLLGEGELSLAEAGRRSGIAYRTLQRWIERSAPPRIGRERIPRLEEVLGGKIVVHDGEGRGMQINESRVPFGEREKPRVYIQPLTAKKEALDAVGRARHCLSILRKGLKSRHTPISELLDLLAEADHWSAESQSFLMEDIDVNDRGEKM